MNPDVADGLPKALSHLNVDRRIIHGIVSTICAFTVSLGIARVKFRVRVEMHVQIVQIWCSSHSLRGCSI